MTTPTFFAQDNFNSYADGPMTATDQGVVWADDGSFTYFLNT